VHARWDEESKTWWTDGEDIPGLTCQGDSFDEAVRDRARSRSGTVARQPGRTLGETVAITVVAARHTTACIAA